MPKGSTFFGFDLCNVSTHRFLQFFAVEGTDVFLIAADLQISVATVWSVLYLSGKPPFATTVP